MPHFDPTITLGNLLQIAAWIVTIVIAYGKLAERLAVLETKLDPLWGQFIERRKIRATLGKQE
jgi:hypothetical protein